MTVFDAFPNAIEKNWQIIPMEFSTVAGNYLDTENAQNIGIIIDEGSSSDANPAPNTASAYSDTLLYAKPSEMPTTDTSELVASYAIKNTITDKLYEIIDAGLGKNQDSGVLEHIELKIRQTGAFNG